MPSPLDTYMAGRERILGRRYTVRRDPELGAEDLAEETGGTDAALLWLADAVEALTVGRR